jgi:signal transduction histidine kinase
VKPPSLRFSLNAWFIGLATLLLVGFSLTLYAGMARALHAGVDDELVARAEALLGICEWDDEAEGVEFKLSPPLAAELDEGHAGRGLEVVTWPEKRVLHRSGDAIPGELPAFESIEDDGVRETRFTDLAEPAGDPPRRLCVLHARVPPAPAREDDPERPAFEMVLRVTESLAPVEAQLARVRWQMGGLFGGAWLVVLAFGAFLSRRFVRPLQELGAAAEAVRAGERAPMPRRGTGDELDRLAELLDGAFASLADAVERQARFTANAAHELRNPIAVVRNAAEVALRQERSGADYRRFLEDTRATALRMGRMVEALLLLARLDRDRTGARLHRVDLAEVARAAAAAADRGRVVVAGGARGAVAGEADLLRVLVDNLVANALKYSERRADGQPVELDVAETPEGRVVLSVRDFGPGIPDDEKERVFEPFHRGANHSADHSGPDDPAGAGLGLSIVADVARLHGATCRLADAHPGTRVTVDFAAAPADASDGTADDPAAGTSDTDGGRWRIRTSDRARVRREL